MKRGTLLALAAAFAVAPTSARAAMRFLVLDPTTKKPVSGVVDVYQGGVLTYSLTSVGTAATAWIPLAGTARTMKVAVGAKLKLQQGPPEKEITIVVRATRIPKSAPPAGASGVTRDRADLQKFNNTASNDSNALVHGQAGVAEDSAGQAHVRGEHAEIAYVVDGVPLPDTLAGREGSVVVASTIEKYNFLTGGFAPEFGGQTAAILDITTLPGAKTFTGDLVLQGGDYSTFNGDLTLQGPIGRRMSYVFNLGATTTQAAQDPHEPGGDDAHNAGTSRSIFLNIKAHPTDNDTLSLTLSQNPDSSEIANRTSLPASFANVGQGFGFLGLRNADGTIPNATPGTLGSAPMTLGTQQQDGMNINQDEVDEFGVLTLQHRFNKHLAGQLSLTALHSGSSLWNTNPGVDVQNLPVDNSIEYNPTVTRNVHHNQLAGNMEDKFGTHDVKFGGLFDSESGQESYQIVPASQLALDELAALDPILAPAGTATSQVDVNGNKVFKATGASPTLLVHRSGYYGAAFGQDTWRLGRFTANYGLRVDWYRQELNVGSSLVSEIDFSPRLNFAYKLNRLTDVRASYDRLVDTPPLAQGAVVGAPIVPEKINQYDLGVSRNLGHGQTFGTAYYYKDIRDQVDTGLLIPGADVGLYSAVNFQRGAVHGVEFSYEISPPKGVGWDSYSNLSYSAAKPEGFDNTGAPAPVYNDHDQRVSLGNGLAYTWRSGASAAATFEYGSGLASSAITSDGVRTPRYQIDLHFTSGNAIFRNLAFTLDVSNLTNQETVINFQSGFSGTRFMEGRRIILGMQAKF